MTIATRAHAPSGLPHCESEINQRTTVAVRAEAVAWGAETVPFAIRPRWRPSEDEIVFAATAVILLSLMAVIAVAAAAILTMG